MNKLELDQWQKDVLATDGNIVLRSGRQCGKSTVVSILSAEYAVKNAKKSIMIISATERQAYLLFSKVLFYINDTYKKEIKGGKDKPTKSEIRLKNGSVIRCLPTGLDGLGIRGYTIDLLIADEAAFIPNDVFPAVTPALVTNNGRIILLSTPFGREGYFYDCFNDDSFTKFHVTTETVAEQRKEPQRTNMLKFLEREKERMTELQYAQEYMGEFVEEFRRFFSDTIIKKACILQRRGAWKPGRYYMGCDIARYGRDEITYEIIDKINEKSMEHVQNLVETKQALTETFDKIVELQGTWKNRKIGIDAGSGSLGVALLDFLLRESSTRTRVVPLTNQKRTIDADGEKTTRLMKEDMYQTLLALMERGVLKLLDDDEVKASLRSVQIEYVIEPGRPTKIMIFGNYTHIVEGLIRAAQLAYQDKSLNLWVASA